MLLQMKLLSVIVPCYNEEENVRDFYDELLRNASFFQEKETEIEIIYVDDGSKDKTEEVFFLMSRFKRFFLESSPPFPWPRAKFGSLHTH